MRYLTCLCGVQIEGQDVEGLEAAYVAHTNSAHADIKISDERWSELRTAIRRAGGWDGARATVDGPVTIRPLAPELEDEYLSYFEGPAFADNPVWARCYCLSYHVNLPPEESEARSMGQNRADRAAQIERGDASGVLAFAGDRIVGWCNASPRASLPLLDQTPEFASDDPEHTASIVCYVIAPQYRGQGIARKLLDGATDLMRARGFLSLDAYPPKNPRTDAGSYHGRLSMYLNAGFEEVRDAGRWVVVRKAL